TGCIFSDGKILSFLSLGFFCSSCWFCRCFRGRSFYRSVRDYIELIIVFHISVQSYKRSEFTCSLNVVSRDFDVFSVDFNTCFRQFFRKVGVIDRTEKLVSGTNFCSDGKWSFLQLFYSSSSICNQFCFFFFSGFQSCSKGSPIFWCSQSSIHLWNQEVSCITRFYFYSMKIGRAHVS